MDAYEWPGPKNYNELLQILERKRSEFHDDVIDRVRYVVAFLARMRETCTQQESLHVDAAELMKLFAALEEVGATGWNYYFPMTTNVADMERGMRYQATRLQDLRETNTKLREIEAIHSQCGLPKKYPNQIFLDLQARNGEVGELRETNKVLRERIDQQKQEHCAFLSCILQDNLQKTIEAGEKSTQNDDPEVAEQLASVVARVESVIDVLGQLAVAQRPAVGDPPPNRPGELSDIEEDEEEVRMYGSGWGDTEDLLTREPADMGEVATWASSSVMAEAGSILESRTKSYPPPLAASTEEAIKADERKTNMLSDVERMLWIQESRDREYLVKRPGPPPTIAKLPPSAPISPSLPWYIYIPLPPNFTIPQSNPRLPSLTFPTPPVVFHFPKGATRDQLLFILRSGCAGGMRNPHLEPVEDLNIIRIRTHELERELKNAIRNIATQESWNDAVGDNWSSEGQGDTYIVSKMDVYFHGISRVENAGSQTGSNESVSEASQDESGGWPEDCFKEEQNEEESNDLPQLRGGDSTAFPDFADSLLSSAPYYESDPRSLADQCDIDMFAPIHEDAPLQHLQAWIEHARVLQLQSASHVRMIDHLNEIIKDTEETIQWQDEELARSHRHIEDLERKMRDRKEETLTAGRRAELAEAEAKVLQNQLQKIHHQVVRFNEELEGNYQRILAKYLGTGASLRGGGESRPETGGPSSVQSPTCSETASTQTVDAHSFYFFPSVSMVVLLSNPLHHFQFPKHTSLARVRQIVYELQTEGRDSDPHLRQVREILQTRDEAGFKLPDTSNGRQILVSAPEIKDDVSTRSGKAGFKGWNRNFGPTEYQYEHMLQDSIESLNPPTEKALLSPTASVYEEKYHDSGVLIDKISPLGTPDETNNEYYNAGDLIDTIEHEAEVSRARSGRSLPYICKEIPKSEIAQPETLSKIPKSATPKAEVCEPESPESESIKTRSRGSSFGENRGINNMSFKLPLPPTKVGPMFPTGTSSRKFPSSPIQSVFKHGMPVLVHSVSPHPTHLHFPDAWNVERPPPIEKVDEPISELDCSADFGYEQDLSDRLPKKGDGKVKEKATEKEDSAWRLLFHEKDAGYEECMTPTVLDPDPDRERCSFCGLPFKEAEPPVSERAESPSNSIEGDKTMCKGGWDPEDGPPHSSLRGGAEEIEWAHLQNARYDDGYLRWSDDYLPSRPLSPRKHFLAEEYDYGTGLPMYDRRQPAHERNIVKQRVRFVSNEKLPTTRGGFVMPPNTPQKRHWTHSSRKSHVQVSALKAIGAARHKIQRQKEKPYDYSAFLERCGGFMTKIKPVGENNRTHVFDPTRKLNTLEEEAETPLRERSDTSPPISTLPCSLTKIFPSSSTEWKPAGEERRCIWVPETVAGPSEARMILKKAEPEEYDGMMWGGYH